MRVRAATLLLGCAVAAACSPSGPSSTGPNPTPSASPSAAASPTPPSPNPEADVGAVIDAFRAFIQTDRTFHMLADVQMTVASQPLDMDIAMDVAKGAERDVIDVRGARASVHLQLIQIGKTIYLKIGDDAWQKASARIGTSNPLASLDIKGFVPVDRVNVAGIMTHHLRVTDPAAFNSAAIGATVTNVVYKTAKFDIYVTDDGVPQVATFDFTASGTFQGKSEGVTARIRYDFSKFDQPIKIDAPH
jgi:hypothetical protein